MNHKRDISRTDLPCLAIEIKDSHKTFFATIDLTVMGRAGSRLPKSSKMLITTEMSTIAQETSPEIQRGIFWCYKKFPKLIFGGNFTGSEPNIDRK